MSPAHSSVTAFLSAVRRRLNARRFWSSVSWSAAAGSVVVLCVALAYVVRGHAVPPAVYVGGGGATLLVAVAAWITRRVSLEAAARFSDQFFDLDDSVSTCHHFRQAGRTGGFYTLQAEQTRGRVLSLAPESIRFRWPRRAVAAALVCGALAALLGFKPPSTAVLERQLRQQQTLALTEQINRQLQEELREIEESVEPSEEQELLDHEKLRQWVDELEKTRDREEALRQYGRLETRLHQASARLMQARDEQLLQRAARQLDKDRATRPMARQLQRKEYEQAARELEKLKPKPGKLEQHRSDLARLKAAARRMTAAVRRQAAPKSAAPGRETRREKGSEASGQSDRLSAGDSAATAGAELSGLEDAIVALDEAVEFWEDALEDAELQALEKGECDAEIWQRCDDCRICAGGKLDELGEELRRLAIRRRVRSKLARLLRSCRRSQAALCASRIAAPGGKEAGWGSDETRRTERDEPVDNRNYTQLKGRKGPGLSYATVESADSGSGVATRRSTRQRRNFQRQVESFVRREDVPDDVKAGVKAYFENIHTADSPTK